MGKRMVLFSDLTGDTIEEGNGATITVKFDDPRKGQYVLDVNASEVADLVAKGRKEQRRGRKHGAQKG